MLASQAPLRKLKIATRLAVLPVKQLLITVRQPVLATLGVIKRVAMAVVYAPQLILMKPMFLALHAPANHAVHTLIIV